MTAMAATNDTDTRRCDFQSTTVWAPNIAEMRTKSELCASLLSPNGPAPDTIEFSFDANSRTLCTVGISFETRAQASVDNMKAGMQLLDSKCMTPSSFRSKLYFLHDGLKCADVDWATIVEGPHCRAKAVPAFVFNRWPEAGLLPNFAALAQTTAELSASPAEKQVCGWAGNPGTNGMRGVFVEKAKTRPDLWEAIVPTATVGPGGTGGRISMEDQVRRWACLVDLPAGGFDGRVPYLLHSGRTILLVERPPPFEPNWYAAQMKPWEHYVPVKADLSDLEEKTQIAVSNRGKEIAARALQLAQSHISFDAAVEKFAEQLMQLH